MIKHNFSITDIFVSAWESTKKNAWFLFIVTIAAGAIMGATSRIPVISQFVSFIISISVMTVSLVIVHGKTPNYDDLLKSFKNHKIMWHYFLASILCALIVLVGFIALILPGIYLAVRLQFYKLLIIENEDLSPVDALKKSMEMTDGHFWNLLGFTFAVIILNILGALFFMVGLLITIPVSMIASAYLYKKLLPVAHHHTNHHEETETTSTVEPTQETEVVKSEEVQQ